MIDKKIILKFICWTWFLLGIVFVIAFTLGFGLNGNLSIALGIGLGVGLQNLYLPWINYRFFSKRMKNSSN